MAKLRFNRFTQKIDNLRDDLDDIIIYLNNIGRCAQEIRLVRNQLDNLDPFILMNYAEAAESIISQNKLYNMH